jgi:putative membrane protein
MPSVRMPGPSTLMEYPESSPPTSAHTPWPPQRWSTIAFLLILALTWVAPKWPMEQALHTSLTLVTLAALWRWGPALGLRRRDHALLMVFLALHTIAARWLYSNVPYDHWIVNLTGWSLDAAMGWRRNQFDRLVHLAYGLCLTPAVFSWAYGRFTPHARHATVVAIGAIMISGLCYEWFEWLVAVVLSPQDAEAYNGQQGDMWDAHKDMLMATLGALCWAPRLSRQSSL